MLDRLTRAAKVLEQLTDQDPVFSKGNTEKNQNKKKIKKIEKKPSSVVLCISLHFYTCFQFISVDFF